MQIRMRSVIPQKGISKANLYVILTLKIGLVAQTLLKLKNDVLMLFTHYLAWWKTQVLRPRITEITTIYFTFGRAACLQDIP